MRAPSPPSTTARTPTRPCSSPTTPATRTRRRSNASYWFVRPEPIPSVAFSWAFFDELALPPGRGSYRYRVVVADGAWDRARAESYPSSRGW
ncbi:DUF6807 family protein [Streptomyces sp. GC420]|uniref:DUF6807 family protein n=1 Tax=Streptomyces sp. GC420 TaxID=2697568 RepID=UPI0037DA6957